MPRNDPLTAVSTRRTPQSEQADPRQVRNSAGGFTFQVDEYTQLRRFLTLGSQGGTYYASEKDLTAQNAAVVLGLARTGTQALVREIVAISTAGRAPRNNPALFALAAAAGLGDDAGRKAALAALPLVARTGTHLFQFITYMEQFRGWGKGARKAIGNWYLDKDAGSAAYQAIKYRQREDWTHRDTLRLAHPFASNLNQLGGTEAHRALFSWICRRDTDLAQLPLIQAFVKAQEIGNREGWTLAAQTGDWVKLIQDNRSLSWEMLPDAALNSPEVWRALIEQGMPQTALMRQLPRLTRLGVIGPTSMGTTAAVAAQLADAEQLAKARVHPVNVLVALRTYASGRSARGKGEWNPVPRITDALDAAFYAAYGAIEPSGKRTLNALDVSGSMTAPAGGLPISCREATAAMSLVTAAVEPSTITVGFTSSLQPSSWPSYGSYRGGPMGHMTSDGITPLDISPRQRLDDAIRKISGLPFGGTDCALPMIWAQQNRIEIDSFFVCTDSETWAGNIHPHQALEEYRQKMGINARLAVVGMTATEFSIADPQDPGSMDVAGMDSAVPQLLSDFSGGRI